MQKPKAPLKPSKYDSGPSKTITVTKILVWDGNNKRFLLLDDKTHPELASVHNGYIYPEYEKLDAINYTHHLENLSYNQLTKIYKTCDIPSDDFIVNPQYNEDGYYDFSTISYEAVNSNYDQELEAYNNRFVVYDELRKKYEKDLAEYEEFKKQEKKRKLQEELKRL